MSDSSQISDEELARRLQEKFLKEWNDSLLANNNNNRISPVPTETTPPKEKIMCLICHEDPQEYVILPMCSTPHIYCLDCADKIRTQVNHNRVRGEKQAETITCPLCNAVTTLDPLRGLSALRRTVFKRRINFKDGICETHNQMYLYFCFECLEPLCYQCTQASKHSKHQYDSLDSAYTKCKKEAKNSIAELSEKKLKINKYFRDIQENLPKVQEASPSLISQLKEHIAKLKELLDKKETEMESAIKQMESRKIATLANEQTWCTQKLELIDTAIISAQKVIENDAKGPMDFFESLYEHKEEFAEIYSIPDKQLTKPMFYFPPLPTEGLEDMLSRMYYKENSRNLINSYINNYEDYSNDDDSEF